MKKALKIIGLLVLALIIGGGIYLWTLNDPKPSGTPGNRAELLAQKMMTAVNHTAWDTTKIVQWTFTGEHDFLWDKEHHLVQVKWDDNSVLLNANSITGKAYKSDQLMTGDEANEMIQTAWSYFCNDAFWLNAPSKAFDAGVKRSIVTQDDGSESLLIDYQTGGVTPGDTYLWHLDKTGLPTSYQMWVSIIPVGGIKVTWEDWTTLESGAKYAKNHMMGSINIGITNAKTGDTLSDLGYSETLFDGI